MENIRSLRLKRGISQKELANVLKVKVSKLSKWERGFEKPNADDYRKLSIVFECDHKELKLKHERYLQKAIPGEGYTTKNGIEKIFLPRTNEPSVDKIKILDIFCGIGGISYGFEWTGFFQTTCGIDLLPDRIKTFHHNHKYSNGIAADITSYSIEKLIELANSPDVIVGGPPCQGFSSIRPYRNLTENDKRNNLVEYFLLVLKKAQPKWFLFENVVGLLSHRKKQFFESILAAFRDAGYKIDWKVINAANFGIPQNRERVLVLGTRSKKNIVWPKPTHFSDYRSMAGGIPQLLRPEPLFHGNLQKALSIQEAIHDLPPVEAGEEKQYYLNDVEPTKYESIMRGETEDLTLHVATAHSEKMLKIIRMAGTNRNALPKGLTTSGFSSCYSRLTADKPSTTITVNFVHPASNRCIHPNQDRALTLREGARLQGFPDWFKFVGSKTEIAKQIGNAVPPYLMKAIAETIYHNF